MCGIIGTYGWRIEPDVFHEMLAQIAHRGPDAEGVYSSPLDGLPVTLGHRRLSIIDLSSAANQPFVKDGLVIVFNGEIFNYRALRARLETEGVVFRTRSDTEVILEAWRRWGPRSLHELRGMFAFALFDERSGALVLARDPFGIKPLFYARRGDGLVFASELKALRPALLPSPKLDEVALVASLVYSWVPESHCIYEGVTKLPPGHWAEIKPGGRFTSNCYWDPRQELTQQPAREVSVEELHDIVEHSVTAHMVADVPVATFLSGGLDSSLLTVMAARQNQNVESYTISFRDEDKRLEAMPDDLFYAKKVASRFGIKLHTIEIRPDVSAMLPQMVDILDEPIGDAAALNAYLICKAARAAGSKVLLSGMGADELFAGYRKHFACLLATRYRSLPRVLRRGLVEPLTSALPVASRHRGYRSVRWAKRFLTFANLSEGRAFHRSYTQFGEPELKRMLPHSLWAAIDALSQEHETLYQEGPSGDQINRMCYTDLRLFLPSLNLAYTDRASMAASTEVRVPFVDKEVVAAAFSIPGRKKIVGRERKAILKRAAEPELPREIVYRPKGLFSAPLRAWIRRDLREMVDDLLLSGELVRCGFLDRPSVRQVVDDDRANIADNSKQIWHLMTMELWLRNHAEARPRADTLRDAVRVGHA